MEQSGNDVAMMDGDDHHISDGPPTNGFLDPHSLETSTDSADGNIADEDKHLFMMDQDDDDPEDGFEDLEECPNRAALPSGCCYDDRMKLHANADFGANQHHPEDPARIEFIMMTLKNHGIVYTGTDSDLEEILKYNPTKYMHRISAREATREEILQCHHPSHFTWVENLKAMPTAELRRITKIMDSGRESLYVGSMTFEASLISAGGAIETCKAVVEGKVKNGFAIIRPPGHHAEYDTGMGFCLFNNVPIAARACQNEFPDLCRKILILDWDVHHGNGIQNMFYDDGNILYISLHVYQDGSFYPGKPDNPMTPDGGPEHCGAAAGIGKNVNIGWHSQGMGDGEYMAAFQKIVMPIGREFNPDLVIISAGFDAADGDELGACFVSPGCYAHMTHMLMSLANGKVAVCLEGGYNLQAISKSALAVAQTLIGEPPPAMQIPPICKEAGRVLAKVQALQAPYWECMRPGVVDVADIQSQNSTRMHDTIRQAQRQTLLERFGMVPLYIQRDALFKSYENQVLVTPGLHDSRRLLVIIHDPPELHGQPDPIDNTLEAYNSWKSDGVEPYIEWAVSEKFGVLDINIPHYITHPEDTDAFSPRADEKALQNQIQELVCYIWDNYIQLYDRIQEIFLVGVGHSYLGVKVLLINRVECKSRVSGVVNFVDSNSLRPVKSDVDPDLSSWYKEHSRVFVANNHACWSNPDLARKIQKRRFGTVIRSQVNGLAKMMDEHSVDVQKWILARVTDDQGDTTEDDKMA